ncbi:MAG: 16S rRNA (guanine(527)-N(7))-methyltransferase RsmG, partial [Thermoguttaceae bacterium]|nr:16S rRNA (guanine(527)-N(7))-methyltransferase RsmG [Thermoguttaceae bacterium]
MKMDGEDRMTNLALTPEVLQQTLDAHRISIPAPQVEQLAQYASLLWNWNDKLNLTRHTTPEKFVGRDLLDSLALARHLAKGEKILDVGTGGGVPGVILKIVRPDLSVWLCEPVGKKATAVADIVDHLGILIPTCRAHAQDLLSSTQFNSLVIRGVTSMSKMLEWFRPYYEAFDRLLLVKGPAWIEERKEARHFGWLSGMSLRRLESYPIPGADAESVILQVCPQDRFVDTGSDRERLEHADADVAQEEDGNVGGQTLEIDATDSEATSVPTEVVEAVDSTDGNDGNTEGSMETEVATDPIATFVEASGTVITIEFAETPSCVIREDLQDRDNLWLASAATDEELDAEAAAMAEAAAKASHGEKNERRERRPRRDDGLSKDERYHRNQVRQLRAKDPRDLTPEEREILLSRMSARKGDVQESPRASHVRTGYDQRREDRRPGGFGGERREDRRSGGFGGERREDRRPGGFGGERREDRRPGGFGGERREDRRSGGFGGERREDRRPGGFGGERREDRRPGGFG